MNGFFPVYMSSFCPGEWQNCQITCNGRLPHMFWYFDIVVPMNCPNIGRRLFFWGSMPIDDRAYCWKFHFKMHFNWFVLSYLLKITMNLKCRRKMAFFTFRLSDHLTTYMYFQLKYLPTRSFIVKSSGSKVYEICKINSRNSFQK